MSSVLCSLTPEHLIRVKAILAKNDHPRLRKELGDRHEPFGSTPAYAESVRNADVANNTCEAHRCCWATLADEGLPVLG